MSDGLNDSGYYGGKREILTDEEISEKQKLHITQETVFKITSGYVDLLVSESVAQEILTLSFMEYCYSGKDCMGCPVKDFRSRDCRYPFDDLKKSLLSYVNSNLALPEERKLKLIFNDSKD